MRASVLDAMVWFVAGMLFAGFLMHPGSVDRPAQRPADGDGIPRSEARAGGSGAPSNAPTEADAQLWAEVLVHPGMIATVRPKRVLLLGQPGPHVICEVLKHYHVDELVIAAGEKSMKPYVPPAACRKAGAGERHTAVKITVLDAATSVFIGKFSTGKRHTTRCQRQHPGLFDVVIAASAAPDPARLPFAEQLILPLSPKLRCLLNENGTIIAQLGPAPHPLGGPGVSPLESRQVGLMTSLANLSRSQIEENGSIKFYNLGDSLPSKGYSIPVTLGGAHLYDQHIPSLGVPMAVAVVCLSRHCSTRYTSNVATIDLQIHRRVVTGPGSLSWYDGSTHHFACNSPSRAWQNLYCRQHPDATSCSDSWDEVAWDARVPEREGTEYDDYELFDNPQMKSFDLQASSKQQADGEKTKDVEVVAIEDIPEEASFLYGAATSMHWQAPVIAQLEENVDRHEHLKKNEHLQGLYTWLERYGYGCVSPTGEYSMYIAVASLDGFMNHGCNASELNTGGVLKEEDGFYEAWPVRSVRSKHRYCAAWQTSRPIPRGTPLTANYKDFAPAFTEEADEAIAEYDGWCHGEKPAKERKTSSIN